MATTVDYKDLFKRLEALECPAETNVAQTKTFSTGVWTLDKLLGGGYPQGRIIELFGGEMSGKSYLALRAIAATQKVTAKDMKCAYLDVEQSFDPKWAATVSVDMSRLIVISPECAEQALEAARAMAEAGIPLIVIDSTAALVPKAELEGEIGDQTIGLQARLISQAMRILVGSAKKGDSTIVFINQLREKVSRMPSWGGDPTTTPGGRALKFYSSVRISVERGQKIKSEEKGDEKSIIGHFMEIKIPKNKCGGIPFAHASAPFYYGTGIDDKQTVLDFAIDLGVIKQTGSKYSFGTDSWIG